MFISHETSPHTKTFLKFHEIYDMLYVFLYHMTPDEPSSMRNNPRCVGPPPVRMYEYLAEKGEQPKQNFNSCFTMFLLTEYCILN